MKHKGVYRFGVRGGKLRHIKIHLAWDKAIIDGLRRLVKEPHERRPR